MQEKSETFPVAFQEYLSAPPPGSALERAIAYGVDPTLTLFNAYGLTREERLDRAGAMVRGAAQIAHAVAIARYSVDRPTRKRVQRDSDSCHV